MASSLIEHKRIKTTHQKAIALQRFIEPMITKAKDATLHNRRQVLRSLKNQDAVKTLFDVIGPSYADRPGGYTRIIKAGYRQGDAAEMAYIELVDRDTDAKGQDSGPTQDVDDVDDDHHDIHC